VAVANAVAAVNPPARLVLSAIASLAAEREMPMPRAVIVTAAGGTPATRALPDRPRRLSRVRIPPIRSARSIRV
jgi:hypothetical protein